MPTVSVDKEDLWERLEQRFCRQFDLVSLFSGLNTLLQQHRMNLTNSALSSALNSMKMSVLYISRDLPPQRIAIRGLRLLKK
jgi:hypothetical protein